MKTESYTTKHVKWIPEGDQLEPGVAYVCDDNLGVMLLCPCGCGRQVWLPMKNREGQGGPSWNVAETDGLLTISPSILSIGGCESHWFLRGGKVIKT